MTTAKLLDHWSPPGGAGDPVACLTTTFAFEAEFFAADCLSRFLSLSMVRSEGDRISSLAALLEEEDRLSEAQVSVLVDRSCVSEKRNLRWDLLPVAAPGGLLHAKVTVLLWERAARVMIGSANLTQPGYRRQVEVAVAFDLGPDCQVPRPFLDDLVAELRRLVDLAPGPLDAGPKQRAAGVVDQLEARIGHLRLPDRARGGVMLAVAPARPGVKPLDQWTAVWKGSRPLRAAVVSPFWDGPKSSPTIPALRALLTGRGAQRQLTLVLPLDPYTQAVRAPAHFSELAADGTAMVGFLSPDPDEPRGLHAKCVVLESDEWVAAMVGSSNATSLGLGLLPTNGHHELNVWIGCGARTKQGKQLRSLACIGDPVDLDAAAWEDPIDDEAATGPQLPLGFEECLVEPGPPPRAVLRLDADGLPLTWSVSDPEGHVIADHAMWEERGRPSKMTVDLPTSALPAMLVVTWDGGTVETTWTANVKDRGALPPPEDLAGLPVEVLLAALGSTRPLPVALETELRRREQPGNGPARDELDPLKRFDSSGLLLHRARELSASLWGLQQRLQRPLPSIEALDWRLRGVLGPLAIADALVAATTDERMLPGEPQFLIGELALTMAAVDWDTCAQCLDRATVRKQVQNVVRELETRLADLGELQDQALADYVAGALAEARR